MPVKHALRQHYQPRKQWVPAFLWRLWGWM